MYRIRGKTGLQAAVMAAAMVFSAGSMAASPHLSLVASMPAKGTGGLIYPTYLVYTRGKLYGIAQGTYNYGESADPYYEDGVFSMSPSGELSIVHEFSQEDGASVGDATDNSTNFVALPDGSLFGTAWSSFQISVDGVYSRLRSYPGGFDGPGVPGNLVVASDGSVYGVDSGSYGTRLVAVAPDGQTSLVYDFGALPATPALVAGRSGELYAALPREGYEGLYPRDTIVKMKDGIGTVVHVLSDDGSEGHYVNDMVVDTDGNLFGSTKGDSYVDSTLFKVTPDGTFSIVHRFRQSRTRDGFGPDDLMLGSDGNIYGATDWNGPKGEGTTFRLAPNGHFSVLLPKGTRRLTQGPARTIFVSGAGVNDTGGIAKLVVPIQDDLTGSGSSSVMLSGPGILSTGTAAGTPTSLAVAAGYFPAAVADFDGDGIADILWTSTKHDLYLWLGGTDGFTAKYAGTYPADWKVVGSGDFDGDGRDDLAWVNASSHQFAYWLMDGAVRKGYKTVSYAAGYYPLTIGDFDANGQADVLWSSSRHDLYAWLSNGQAFTSKFVANFPAAWRIVGRGDLDDDGNADLVWMTDDGLQWGYWLMKAGAIGTVKSFAVPASVTGSRVAAVADYNGDGAADVLWSDGNALTLWTNQDGCLDVPGCAFSTSVPGMTLSAGQTVFNSGLPANLP